MFKKIKSLFETKKTIWKPVNYKNSTTKRAMNSCCTLKFSSETEQKQKTIEEKLKKLIKKYINSPEKLIQYMKLKGLKVYKFKYAGKLLEKLGENEGFLTPLKGFKALILNFIIGIIFEKKLKLSFETKEMFILDTGETEIYTIARALHKYYGYKNKMPGFDYDSQEIFKKACRRKKKLISPFSDFSLEDIYSCKEAMARDMAAINFTIELSVEYERSKKVLKKIQNEKSTNV